MVFYNSPFPCAYFASSSFLPLMRYARFRGQYGQPPSKVSSPTNALPILAAESRIGINPATCSHSRQTSPQQIDMKMWKDHSRRTPPASPKERAAKAARRARREKQASQSKTYLALSPKDSPVHVSMELRQLLSTIPFVGGAFVETRGDNSSASRPTGASSWDETKVTQPQHGTSSLQVQRQSSQYDEHHEKMLRWSLPKMSPRLSILEA